MWELQVSTSTAAHQSPPHLPRLTAPDPSPIAQRLPELYGTMDDKLPLSQTPHQQFHITVRVERRGGPCCWPSPTNSAVTCPNPAKLHDSRVRSNEMLGRLSVYVT